MKDLLEGVEEISIIIPAKDRLSFLMFWRQYFVYIDRSYIVDDVLMRYMPGRVHQFLELKKEGTWITYGFCWVLRKDVPLFLQALREAQEEIELSYPEAIEEITALKDKLFRQRLSRLRR